MNCTERIFETYPNFSLSDLLCSMHLSKKYAVSVKSGLTSYSVRFFKTQPLELKVDPLLPSEKMFALTCSI